MVSYDEYEQHRCEAEIRAVRIWGEHQWDGTVWPSFKPDWTDEQAWIAVEEMDTREGDEEVESISDYSDNEELDVIRC
jgi:hypothetical protein